MDDGVQKAKLPFTRPWKSTAFVNFLRLQYRTSPAKAIMGWSSAIHNQDEPALKNYWLRALKYLEMAIYPSRKKNGAEVAYREIERFLDKIFWASNPEKSKTVNYLLKPTIKTSDAGITELLDKFPEDPEAIFLIARLSAHLKMTQSLCPWKAWQTWPPSKMKMESRQFAIWPCFTFSTLCQFKAWINVLSFWMQPLANPNDLKIHTQVWTAIKYKQVIEIVFPGIPIDMENSKASLFSISVSPLGWFWICA